MRPSTEGAHCFHKFRCIHRLTGRHTFCCLRWCGLGVHQRSVLSLHRICISSTVQVCCTGIKIPLSPLYSLLSPSPIPRFNHGSLECYTFHSLVVPFTFFFPKHETCRNIQPKMQPSTPTTTAAPQEIPEVRDEVRGKLTFAQSYKGTL